MGTVLGVGLEKGGVGKSVTTSNLAVALSRGRPRRRVLVIDLDAQGHAGKALAAKRDEGPNVSDVLWGGVAIRDAIRREPRVPGVDVLAGSRRMAAYDIDASSQPDRERLIERMLEPVRDAYDFILCDMPPGLGLVHVGMHVAADWMLATLEPEADAVAGLIDLRASLEQARDRLGARSRLLGVLLTKVDLRTREHAENVREIRRHFGNEVFSTMIRLTTRVREASRECVSVIEYAPDSTAAQDYVAATREFLRRVEQKGV